MVLTVFEFGTPEFVSLPEIKSDADNPAKETFNYFYEKQHELGTCSLHKTNKVIKQAKCDLNFTHERDLSVQKAPW